MNKVQPGICSQRPPKKYLKKSLHGRVRGMMIPYDEYERAKKFYVYVFGWDVMRVPQGVFIEDTDERPSLMCATGPSQVSWEASQPGYVWAQLVAREHCEKPQVVYGSKHGCSTGRYYHHPYNMRLESGEPYADQRGLGKFCGGGRPGWKPGIALEMSGFPNLGRTGSGL